MNPSLLSVGDSNGIIHVLELPYTVYKKLNEEENTMRNFLEREVAKVTYFESRFDNRIEKSKEDKV